MAFNKMFVMVPVMLAARKLDGEDPDVIFLLRCAYGIVQTCIVLFVAYVYVQATTVSTGKDGDRVIYVPPPPNPFEDPNAKKKYTESKFGSHLASQARSLLGSTLFGVCMTLGLHYWKGMIVGLAIQSIMGPLNLIENPVAKCILMGGGLGDAAEKKIFGEKLREELTDDDEVVDKEGNPIVRKAIKAGKKDKGGAAPQKKKDERTFEEILLDTWDAGAEADVKPLMSVLSKKTVNYKTSESQWTPIMVMSAIGVKETEVALTKMKDLGANPSAVDEEGWNALHWAAFHGSPAGAKFLLSEGGYGSVSADLISATDKEGKTPLDHAKAEGNDEVARLIEEAVASAEAKKEGGAAQDEGLRKRK